MPIYSLCNPYCCCANKPTQKLPRLINDSCDYARLCETMREPIDSGWQFVLIWVDRAREGSQNLTAQQLGNQLWADILIT